MKEGPVSQPTSDRFRALVESAPDAVIIVDAEGKISLINRQTEKLFGYSREELLGQPVEMLVPAAHRAEHVNHRTAYAKHPQARPMGAGLELFGLRKDGTEFPVEISLSALNTGEGIEIISTIRDITRQNRMKEELREASRELERRVEERAGELARTVRALEAEIAIRGEAQEALERERDRAKSYLDIAEVILLVLDRAGRVVMINRKGHRLLGYSESELMGQDWFEMCLPARTRAKARQIYTKILAGDLVEALENPVLTSNGEERLVAWYNSLVRDRIGNILGTLSSGEDITDRRRSEEAVRKLALIVESSEEAIIGKTLDGIILSWNSGAERLYGYTAEEAIGRHVTMLSSPDHPDEIEHIMESIRQGERVGRIETVRRGKGGKRVEISLSVFPVLNAGGKPASVATIARDISERKRMEQQLRQSHKMEAIGRLAGGIAHDFNNLLGVVLGDCELLLNDSVTPVQREKLIEIQEAGGRAASLTRQLLAFSRQQVLDTQILNLNTVLAGFESMLRRLAGDQIVLHMLFAPSVAPVRADPNQLLQVLLNMVVNARDAMPNGGTIRIETASSTLDEAYVSGHPSMRSGPYVMISVADNGPGMDAETLSHLFEPFFTTKTSGQGTGMGLATAYALIQQVNGSIWAYSEPGHGTLFKIFLPSAEADAVAPEAEAAPAQAESADELPRGKETVLLVEDSGLLRRVTAEFLKRVGYTVIDAADGPEALDVVSNHRGKIDLLLTDLAMPGMNGKELAQKLVGRLPKLKVLYTSGYAGSILQERDYPGLSAAFLEKPFTWQSLAQKVRAVLDHDSPDILSKK
ncbi:MAG: PAS domain S-box protein [Acidobacteriota bacterium]|nr:PAS domain S-box protein [Acidobacteriota bacterium]